MNGEAGKPQSHIIAALSYLLGFITGLIFLYVEPYNEDPFVRFHARQSIGFSVAWFAINVILGVFIAVLPQFLSVILTFILDLLNIGLAVYWVFLMYKAYTGERYRIPELADIVQQLEAAFARHPQVRKQDMRVEAADKLQSPDAVLGNLAAKPPHRKRLAPLLVGVDVIFRDQNSNFICHNFSRRNPANLLNVRSTATTMHSRWCV